MASMEVEDMETIKLFKKNEIWMARFSKPEIRELFGTDTLPTAFTSHISVNTVLTEIERLNPDAVVIIDERF